MRNLLMIEINQTHNLVLIGMPGVGKSTVGVLLAKASRRGFLDTDVYIQAVRGQSLQAIIEKEGLEAFCLLEQRCVSALDVRSHVIATGGSVVYSDSAMRHLRQDGAVVHLDMDLARIERRLGNLNTRGVVIAPGMTLEQLYRQRQPLYRKWADLTIQCEDKNQDQVVAEILEELSVG